MCNRLFRIIFISIATLCQFGCGGGSSSDSANDFSGVWRIVLSTFEDTCGIQTSNLELELRVDQNGDVITINSGANNQFTGTTTGADSFNASVMTETNCSDQSGDPIEGSTSIYNSTYTFTSIDGDTGMVQFTEERGNCSSNVVLGEDSSCSFTETGPARRLP